MQTLFWLQSKDNPTTTSAISCRLDNWTIGTFQVVSVKAMAIQGYQVIIVDLTPSLPGVCVIIKMLRYKYMNLGLCKVCLCLGFAEGLLQACGEHASCCNQCQPLC